MRKGAFLAGYYGFNNAGDELLLRALILQLRQANPFQKISVLSADPDRTASLHTVDAVPRSKPWMWIPTFLHHRDFYLGGGGLLQEFTSVSSSGYYLGLLVLAKLFGCRTHVRAIGVDLMIHPWNRWLTRWVLNRWVDEVSVRDTASAAILAGLGVTRPITVESDLALEPGQNNSASKGSSTLWVISGATRLTALDWAKSIDDMRKTTSTQAHIGVYFPKQDEAFSRAVGALCNPPVQVEVWRTFEDLDRWTRDAALVISSRFHALVLAHNAGVPFIGLGPQPKIRILCEQMKRPYRALQEKSELETLSE